MSVHIRLAPSASKGSRGRFTRRTPDDAAQAHADIRTPSCTAQLSPWYLYIYMFRCLEEWDISMVVVYYASGIIKYHWRATEQSNAPLLNIQDTNGIEI